MWAHEFSNRVRNINNIINAHKILMFVHKPIVQKANKQKRIFLLHTELNVSHLTVFQIKVIYLKQNILCTNFLLETFQFDFCCHQRMVIAMEPVDYGRETRKRNFYARQGTGKFMGGKQDKISH
jgi:hypothetical protein